MAEKKTVPRSHPSDSRELLLQAAKIVFAQSGFEGATVKDLADEADVNISLVSYHFGGKEGLYRTCLESFGLERVETAERVLKAPVSVEEFKLRLRLYVEDMIEIQTREPYTCRIIHRSMSTLDPIATEVFKLVFSRMHVALINFLSAAQKAKFIKPDLDIQITGTLMFGSIIHMLQSQDLARTLGKPTLDNKKYAQAVIDHWIKVFYEGTTCQKQK